MNTSPTNSRELNLAQFLSQNTTSTSPNSSRQQLTEESNDFDIEGFRQEKILSPRELGRWRKSLFSVYVSRLPTDVCMRELVPIFSRVGVVKDIHIAPHDGQGYTYGFVRFGTLQEARNAVSSMNGRILGNRHLLVDLSSETRSNLNGVTKELPLGARDKLLRRDYPSISPRRRSGDTDEDIVQLKIQQSIAKLKADQTSAFKDSGTGSKSFVERLEEIIKMVADVPGETTTTPTADEGPACPMSVGNTPRAVEVSSPLQEYPSSQAIGPMDTLSERNMANERQDNLTNGRHDSLAHGRQDNMTNRQQDSLANGQHDSLANRRQYSLGNVVTPTVDVGRLHVVDPTSSVCVEGEQVLNQCNQENSSSSESLSTIDVPQPDSDYVHGRSPVCDGNENHTLCQSEKQQSLEPEQRVHCTFTESAPKYINDKVLQETPTSSYCSAVEQLNAQNISPRHSLKARLAQSIGFLPDVMADSKIKSPELNDLAFGRDTMEVRANASRCYDTCSSTTEGQKEPSQTCHTSSLGANGNTSQVNGLSVDKLNISDEISKKGGLQRVRVDPYTLSATDDIPHQDIRFKSSPSPVKDSGPREKSPKMITYSTNNGQVLSRQETGGSTPTSPRYDDVEGKAHFGNGQVLSRQETGGSTPNSPRYDDVEGRAHFGNGQVLPRLETSGSTPTSPRYDDADGRAHFGNGQVLSRQETGGSIPTSPRYDDVEGRAHFGNGQVLSRQETGGSTPTSPRYDDVEGRAHFGNGQVLSRQETGGSIPTSPRYDDADGRAHFGNGQVLSRQETDGSTPSSPRYDDVEGKAHFGNGQVLSRQETSKSTPRSPIYKEALNKDYCSNDQVLPESSTNLNQSQTTDLKSGNVDESNITKYNAKIIREPQTSQGSTSEAELQNIRTNREVSPLTQSVGQVYPRSIPCQNTTTLPSMNRKEICDSGFVKAADGSPTSERRGNFNDNNTSNVKPESQKTRNKQALLKLQSHLKELSKENARLHAILPDRCQDKRNAGMYPDQDMIDLEGCIHSKEVQYQREVELATARNAEHELLYEREKLSAGYDSNLQEELDTELRMELTKNKIKLATMANELLESYVKLNSMQ